MFQYNTAINIVICWKLDFNNRDMQRINLDNIGIHIH